MKDGDVVFGALLGAGVSLTTVVVGTVTLVGSFHAMERPFLRDIIFYIVTVFTFYVCNDHHISFFEALGAGVYLTTVVVGAVTLVGPFHTMERPLLRVNIFYIVTVFFTFYVRNDHRISFFLAYILTYIVCVIVVIGGRVLYQKYFRPLPPVITRELREEDEPTSDSENAINRNSSVDSSLTDHHHHPSKRNIVMDGQPSVSYSLNRGADDAANRFDSDAERACSASESHSSSDVHHDNGSDVENMKNVRHLLAELMDPDFGLLDKLLNLCALTFPEIRRIKSERSISDRNNKLLELIFNGMKHQALLTALRETGQKHLYNLVKGNGVYRPEYGTVWPLQERETQILDGNRFNLVDIIDPCDLIARIFSKGVINNRQQRHINSLPNNTEKSEALLDILRQGSEECYWTTVLCLRESNQSGIADILMDGGVLAQVHVSSEGETEQVDAEEEHIIELIENLLQDKTLPQYQRIRERLDLRIMRARKGKSIVLYIYCKTLEELLNLHELLTNGELKKRVATVFDLLISKRETTVSEVSWSEGEFKKFKTNFESDQQSLSNAKCDLLSTCHARTTDYLASERSKTLKIDDKEETLNTQATSNALDDSTPLQKHTQLSLGTKQELLTETTSSSYTSLDAKSYTASPLTTVTEDTSRKSQAIYEIPEESTVTMTTADALKSTQDSETSEVFGTRRELGEGCVKDYAAASSNVTVIEKTRVVEGKAEKQLREITECPICMSSFTDPRILPCIHTFCFECLNRTAEAAKKKPGDRMPCPVCSKDFFIPADGVNGLHKNYFMENLLEFKISLQIGGAIVICDMCNVRNEGKIGDISKATMRCLECQDYYCNSCVKIHQFQKLTRNHQLVKIGREIAPEMKRQFGTLHCSKHTQRTLDYYCADCKKIVCVSCFVESHASHKCKDVTTVGEEFRQTIEKKAEKISTYAKETLLLRNNNEKRKADFWKEIAEQEQKIHERSQELKDTIDRHVLDRHTNSLLDELSVIKSKHLKEMETEMEKIDRYITTLKDFESYCTELALEGSARDICSSFDELVLRANELGKKHEALNDQPHHSVGFYFQATDLADVFQNADSNCVGKIKEKTSRFEDSAAVVGLDELRDSNKERRKNKSTPANSTGINRCRVQ